MQNRLGAVQYKSEDFIFRQEMERPVHIIQRCHFGLNHNENVIDQMGRMSCTSCTRQDGRAIENNESLRIAGFHVGYELLHSR